ncbi:acetyltransferase [Bdellovibrio bacteriovorus]|uniref:Hexapeptide transferase family protein n=1 Tax=Bdellovibrio bacteriovorus (strain ATCC 15356 / DSM 50701 / NCIMB 9529 / HD100) TaxID=264462 RepID=Q6MMF0_BDEBA|nr:acetyltransferase [Bdellovibrio bacteriovorus]CAE79554.1 hexapeptide transferase family protein [Bdellovibrio bacteriovorus HD100]
MSVAGTIVLGAGGHSKVVVDTLIASSVVVVGLTDIDLARQGTLVLNIPVIGTDNEILKYATDGIVLALGIGSVRASTLREKVFQKYTSLGYSFPKIVHPSAILSSVVHIGEGVQIMAGCIVQAGVEIGDNSILNTGAQLDHDCIIGKNVHISPGANLSGGVVVEDGAHVGVGATIIQGVRVGARSTVGAGAVVVKDVPPDTIVFGVPAREVKSQVRSSL